MRAWRRTPQHDKRICAGDDFVGDAWTNAATGEVTYTAVGELHPDREPQPSNPYPHDPDLNWY
jgi:hypothetical protein